MHEDERNFFLVAVRDKARGLVGAVRVDYAANLHFALAGLDHLALVRHDSDRPAVDAGVGRDNGFAVVGLVLDHRVGVDQALEQRAHRVGLAVDGHALVDFLGGHGRSLRRHAVKSRCVPGAQLVHESAQRAQRIVVVLGLVVAHATDLGVGGSSAKGFVVDFFADGGFDEVASGQKDAAGALDDEGLVAHDGQVGSASHTGSHYGRQLRNPKAAHHRVVAKNSPKVLFVRENLVLHRQVHAGGIHQIKDRNPVLHRNFLGAQVFFTGHREPCPRLHRRVVGHHHAGAAGDASKNDHHARRGTSPVLSVHSVGRECADFNLGGVGIQQTLDPLASAKLALLGEFLESLFASTLGNFAPTAVALSH